jgi:hypothetical protein
MGGNQIADRAIQAGNRGCHLLGLGLPQPRGALDVGSSLTPHSLQFNSGMSARSLMLASIR